MNAPRNTVSPNNLKFRVFDPVTNKFTYFGIREGMGNLPTDIPDRNITQFTGKYDKNGVEIYAGDFLYREAANRYYRCDYYITDSCFELVDSDGDGRPLSDFCSSRIRIVGNAFM